MDMSNGMRQPSGNEERRPSFYFRWARLSGDHVHSETPTVEQCEADGYRHVGNDPRYENSLLMQKDDDATCD